MKRKTAIALGYNYKKDNAPKILAQGKGTTAEKIIALAKEHHIPVCSNPLLAEQLALLDIGEVIPEELYQVVAEILIFVNDITKGEEG